ncbi:isocitrate lyase/PEP mutase family protein [Actinophytocola sp.]|uniref:isocitrate lyase/PEP mutase family protein n=1 Tax=Actinophytocola sp. TaxID=1872138 RepID=UPI003D6B1C06
MPDLSAFFGGTRPAGPAALRTLVNGGGGAIVLPGVTDALSARLVEAAGFPACYLTGAGMANVLFGVPDIGVVTQTEVVEHARRVVDSVGIPVVVDADTGYGGHLSVMRTVHLLETAGVAGIQLEDQAIPKRCGHFDGKRLVPREEMVARLLATQRARNDVDLLVIARTDAIAVEGFAAAIERAKTYRDAGADVIFIEALRTIEEIRAVPKELPDVPLLINIVEGGRTPELPAAELDGYGYRIVLHANFLMRAMLHAGTEALRALHVRRGSASLHDRLVSWDTRQSLVGQELADQVEDQIRDRATELTG